MSASKKASKEWGVLVKLDLSAWKREKHVLVGLFEFWRCCFVSAVAFVMLVLGLVKILTIVFVFLMKECEENELDLLEVVGMVMFLRRTSFNIA